MRVTASYLVVVLLLAGCAGNVQWRDSSGTPDSSSASSGQPYLDVERYRTTLYAEPGVRRTSTEKEVERRHTIAYIEFDEQGDYLDRHQLVDALASIRRDPTASSSSTPTVGKTTRAPLTLRSSTRCSPILPTHSTRKPRSKDAAIRGRSSVFTWDGAGQYTIPPTSTRRSQPTKLRQSKTSLGSLSQARSTPLRVFQSSSPSGREKRPQEGSQGRLCLRPST